MTNGLAAQRHAEVFDERRPLLFNIAYRMLGSVADAEDVVQDAYLRWQRVDPGEIERPDAWLSTVVTRQSIDQLRAAKTRREVYVGPWLPEPLVSEQAPDAAEPVMLAESLSMAFLVMLERLTPLERACFLLREVFGYSYRDVAETVGRNEAACRQLVHRARTAIEAGRPRFEAAPDRHEQLVSQFMQACSDGDMDGLMAVLHDDITFWSDGGAETPAARRPIHGADAVARFLLGGLRLAPSGFQMRPAWVNGEPGIVGTLDGQLFAVGSIEVADDAILAVRFVLNPDKLRGAAVS
jgi:RNA polymerase sigma-70 factor (ECF subfamily)